ncbi:MAG: type II toxin-antitoxin system VapC family toxin [Luteolibacter sp.]
MAILLDTVALSELRKKSKAASSVIGWQKAEGGALAYVSVITMNEIRYGAKKVADRDPGFAASLEKWYGEILMANSLYSILGVTLPIAEAAADIRATYGTAFNDSLIAATAKVHDLTLATRNTSDFTEIGIALVNPWKFQA